MAEPLAAMTTRWIVRAWGPECLQIFTTGASGHQGFPYNTPSSQQERPSSVACFRHGSNSFHALQTRPRGGAEGAASPQTLRQKDCCGANALEREPGPVLHRTASRMPSGPSPGPGHDIQVMASGEAASGGRRAGTAPGFAEGYDLRHRYRGGGFFRQAHSAATGRSM